MMTIKYSITFFSDWHIGSGLTGGAGMDALVLKDKDELPYIPGKTLKGLLKNAALDIIELKGGGAQKNDFIKSVFGFFDDNIDELLIQENENTEKNCMGNSFFTNATLSAEIKQALLSKEKSIRRQLYREISSTAISANGIAKKGSLRKIEVVCPLKLSAEIINVEQKYLEDIQQCMKWIKRMGLNRNRGLGRCIIRIEK